MPNNDGSKDDKPPDLKELENEAAKEKALKEAAEHRAARAKALLPTLPDELPANTIDASSVGAGLGALHAYRAVMHAVHDLAAEVKNALPAVENDPEPRVLIATAQIPSLYETRFLVERVFTEAKRLIEAAGGTVPDEPPPDSQSPGDVDEAELATIAALVMAASTLLPLIFKMFESKTTLKSGEVKINEAALLDGVAGCLHEVGVDVYRLDGPAFLAPAYVNRWKRFRSAVTAIPATALIPPTQVGASATSQRIVLDSVAAVAEHFAKQNPEAFAEYLTLLETKATAWATAAGAEAAAASARNARSQARDKAEQLLDALVATGTSGWSPLALASAAELISDHAQLHTLTIEPVEGVWEAAYRDKSWGHDSGSHQGGAIVHFRLMRADGTIVLAGLRGAISSAEVQLKEGDLELRPYRDLDLSNRQSNP